MSAPTGWSHTVGAEKYAIDRDDGLWRICRVRVGDKWRYTLWRNSREMGAWAAIESFDSAADAAEYAVKLEEGYDPRKAE